ncbi:MAG: replication factor C large subunit [Thermoplasmatales archaeon]
MEIPWTEKYRPTMMSQIRREKTVEYILSWAKKWEAGTSTKKAVLLYGPPGTGKTSTAMALAREMGWEYMEFNASDIRSKDAIEQTALKGSQYYSLFGDRGGKKLIVMDEVDSLYERNVEGADAGGKAALLRLVEATENPVVLIANDLYALRSTPTGKAISDKCELVEFRRYMKSQIMSVLREILENEKIYCPPEKIQLIAENANGDLRAAINDLQGGCTSFPVEQRDVELSTYNVVNDLLHHHYSVIMDARMDIINVGLDPNDFLLYLLENVFPLKSSKADLYRALDYISKSDLFLGRVSRRMDYSLWSYATDFMAMVSTTDLKSDKYEKFQFPSLIKNMAMLRKYRNMRKNFAFVMGRYIHKSALFMNEGTLLYVFHILRRNPELKKNIEESTGMDLDETLSMDL